MSHTNNYFKIINLNPAAPGTPINNPLDERAFCYFGFASDGQTLQINPGTTGLPQGVRVLYSFDHVYQQGSTFPPPPPPTIHGVLLPFGPGPFLQASFYNGEQHDRRHVTVWLDPTSPTFTGPLEVWIGAQRKNPNPDQND